MIRKGIKVTFNEYCITRKNPDSNEWMLFMEEVNSQCPKCGKKFLYTANSSIMKGAEIAHVFPNKPTPSEKEILKDVEVDGDSSESFENKIALCKDCHDAYDAHKTVDSYNEMLELKRRLNLELKAKKMLSGENIEDELTAVIKSLSCANNEDLEGAERMRYDTLQVSQKVDIPYLCKRIEGDVTSYYPFCRKKFKEIADAGDKFTIICLSVKKNYLKLKAQGLDKEEIFEQLTDWLESKTHAGRNACEIMISFFVQNCDVYDEISK